MLCKTYTPADMGTNTDIFAAKTKTKHTMIVYPEEIQKELREKYQAVLPGGPSEEILDEIQTDWDSFLFKVRLFYCLM